ncbi:MAG: IS5 family transposase [Flavobacteriales bacterium]|nr:IS5 family transposase [Flavobacteriales bacterium]
MDCTDAQWVAVKDLLSPIQERTETRGRKPLDARAVFNGVLWICRTGARWQDLPPRYPPVSVVPSVFPTLVSGGRMGQGAVGLGAGPQTTREDRHHRMLHRWHLLQCQKRGLHIGPTKRGKGTKIMVVTDAAGLPIAVRTFGASTHEVKLVTQTLAARFMEELPEVLIGDKAYDSDELDRKLKRRKVRMIAPNRAGRSKSQDGRALRRYKRRWKVERCFAWLNNFRRTVVRYEYHSINFLGFVQLACAMILMRKLF